MSILIKGLKMPKEKALCLVLRPSGQLFVDPGYYSTEYEAVELPLHGQLKDADWIREEIDKDRPGRMYEDAWALTVIDNAPTIIEAEEGAEE